MSSQSDQTKAPQSKLKAEDPSTNTNTTRHFTTGVALMFAFLMVAAFCGRSSLSMSSSASSDEMATAWHNDVLKSFSSKAEVVSTMKLFDDMHLDIVEAFASNGLEATPAPIEEQLRRGKLNVEILKAKYTNFLPILANTSWNHWKQLDDMERKIRSDTPFNKLLKRLRHGTVDSDLDELLRSMTQHEDVPITGQNKPISLLIEQIEEVHIMDALSITRGFLEMDSICSNECGIFPRDPWMGQISPVHCEDAKDLCSAMQEYKMEWLSLNKRFFKVSKSFVRFYRLYEYMTNFVLFSSFDL